ncbi:MAG: type III pantothenate kinase, partial [Deltaproteobacteria bacterium]|nr:type III pantothenate kinase [Deltaproteobacteria bacterium]
MEKILAIDIGNSNTVIGFFIGRKIKWHRRFETDKTLSHLRKFSPKDVDGVVVASVVPKINRPLRLMLRKKFSLEPIFVTSKIKLPIKIKTKIPLQVGADRIANAVGAYY